MGSSRRFALVLAGWVGALALALLASVWAWATPDTGAVRVVTALGVLAAVWGLVRHVERTNVTVARFVEALGHGDFATRFNGRGGAGFDALGEALDTAMKRLQAERSRGAEELRFLDALVDDAPVAILTVEGSGVSLANKAARRLFGDMDATQLSDFAVFGDAFAHRLAASETTPQDVLALQLPGGAQRAIVRTASLERLGVPVRVVTVEPIQRTLDALQVETQSDLVRVLTHEIGNSLTPVTSLAATASALLEEDTPDLARARLAVSTLTRRAESLRRFIDGYRAVARPPEPRVRRFAAEPFAAELARLFAVEWTGHALELVVEPGLQIDADPDLLAQALINLLRNAAQASAGRVRLAMRSGAIEVEDDGPGVPDGIRGDIFLPFFTTRPGGSGIGLNLVRQIAVAHGWRVEVATGTIGGALLRLVSEPRH
jgi:signal transduction histidine kinase